jgi:hypothetical protein
MLKIDLIDSASLGPWAKVIDDACIRSVNRQHDRTKQALAIGIYRGVIFVMTKYCLLFGKRTMKLLDKNDSAYSNG